jgi:hypothetical protein
MDSKTIISIVTGYHPDQFAINMFDYIGHDHLTYFTLSNFKLIAEKFNLKVLSFSKVEQKGGSINILMAQSNSDFVADSSIFQNLQREYFLDINSDNYFLELRKKVDLLKHKIQLILSEKFVGMPIVGLGASISTTYLMNYFELGNKISFLLDDDVNKIGRFAPRFGLEVKNLSEIKNYDVDVLVLLAWQHTNKLKERLKMLKFEGNLVIPLPRIQLELFS